MGVRLLVLADSARLRQHTASASSPTTGFTRSRASTASSGRWTGSAGSSLNARDHASARASQAPRTFLALQHFAARLRRACLAGPLGALVGGLACSCDPVLLARVRLHRDMAQRPRRRSDRARDARARTSRDRAEALQHHLPAGCSTPSSALRRPVLITGHRPEMVTAKVSWDNACYWAITALLCSSSGGCGSPGSWRRSRPLMRQLLRPARAACSGSSLRNGTPTPGAIASRVAGASSTSEFLRAAAGRPERRSRIDDD